MKTVERCLYYQQYKSCPEILLSDNIGFEWILAGFIQLPCSGQKHIFSVHLVTVF